MTLDYRAAFTEETARFVRLLRLTAADTGVPSCPGWTAADLLYHQADGLHFWAAVVADLLDDPAPIEDLERPDDDQLATAVEDQAAAFVTAVDEHDLGDECWSWHPDGHTVGWTLRRQTHEALIHRVDAALTAGQPVAAPSVELAADCVDELVHMFLGVPEWGSFETEDTTVRLEATDRGDRWTLRFGHFSGTSPNTGNVYDLDAAVVDVDADADAVIRGAAWDLATWAWGRGSADHLIVDGAPDLVVRLRTLLAESTQ